MNVGPYGYQFGNTHCDVARVACGETWRSRQDELKINKQN